MHGICSVNNAGLLPRGNLDMFQESTHRSQGGTVTSFIPKAIVLATAAGMLASSLSMAAGQTYYRWKDDRGNVYHSDRPPPKGTEYEVVSTKSYDIRRVEGDEGAVPLDTTPEPGNEFETFPKEETAPKKSAEMCARAQENLATLQNGGRIRLRDENGEFRFLSEEEKADQMTRAQAVIDQNC